MSSARVLIDVLSRCLPRLLGDQWRMCWVYSECEKFLASLNFALGLAYLRKGGAEVSDKLGGMGR